MMDVMTENRVRDPQVGSLLVALAGTSARPSTPLVRVVHQPLVLWNVSVRKTESRRTWEQANPGAFWMDLGEDCGSLVRVRGF